MRYTFCPKCGIKLTDKQAGDDGNVPFCPRCNKLWFDAFASCSIVLVANEYHEILLLKQNYLSKKYATFVSGYILPGETAEEAAIREVREEVGIELSCLDYGGTYWFPEKDLLMHGFIGITDKCSIALSSEVDSAEWTPINAVEAKIFPNSPGNAAYALYRLYSEKYIQGKL